MNDISVITLSVMNRVDSLTKIKEVVTSVLDFNEGNYNILISYQDNVIIRYDAHSASITIYKSNINNNATDLEDYKDMFLAELINKINAKSICVNIKLVNGFSKYNFYKCTNYNPPKKTWLDKLFNFIGGN